MITRRKMLRSVGITSLALPALSGLSFAETGRKKNIPLPDPDDPDYWAAVRDRFMLAKDKVFFNPGTIGAMPRVVVDAVTDHMRNLATNVADWAYKDDSKERYISGYQDLMYIRTKVAKLFNCDPKEIALTDNVTNSMSYIANGMTLQPGDEIITSNQEHGGGQSSWMLKAKRFGSVFSMVTLPKPIRDAQEVFDIIKKEISPKTKVIMLSHMITGSGAILPVKEICAEARMRGIFTVLDGAQTVAQVKLDFKDIGCDAYVGCFHKWMGAPPGTGFMFVRADRMKDLWTTVASGRWDNHEDEGYRFIQRGTGNFSILAGLDSALDFHFEMGPERVYERIKFLGSRLRAGLRANKKVKIFSPADEALCAGITVYNIEGWKGGDLQDAFWEKGRMRPRASGEVFGVRHCTNIFNSEAEIDRALEIVGELSGT